MYLTKRFFTWNGPVRESCPVKYKSSLNVHTPGAMRQAFIHGKGVKILRHSPSEHSDTSEKKYKIPPCMKGAIQNKVMRSDFMTKRDRHKERDRERKRVLLIESSTRSCAQDVLLMGAKKNKKTEQQKTEPFRANGMEVRAAQGGSVTFFRDLNRFTKSGQQKLAPPPTKKCSQNNLTLSFDSFNLIHSLNLTHSP